MGVGDRDGVGISALSRYGVSVCDPMAAVFSASMWMGGWVDGRAVDGMAAHVPSVTHEVESRLLQGQNVV